MSSNKELIHYGIKGMRWGHSKIKGLEDIPDKVSYEAKKDAHEFARAKMFYGEGAGNRRKLINRSVEEKSKRDPSYKKAFDHHLSNQQLDKHATAARGERKRKDLKNNTARTARGIKNTLYGNPQYATVSAILLTTAGSAAYKAGLHKKVAAYGKTAYNAAKVNLRAQQIKNQFRQSGWN